MPFRWRPLFLCLLLAAALSAQEPWQTSAAMPGVDFSGLSAVQKQTALQMLREQSCTCGCAMKVAECRFKDPNCAYSTALSAIVVKGVKDGKTPDEIMKLQL